MEIDYRKYSLEELYDVLGHINKEKYPERLNQIKQEIERKENDPELKKAHIQQLQDTSVRLNLK